MSLASARSACCTRRSRTSGADCWASTTSRMGITRFVATLLQPVTMPVVLAWNNSNSTQLAALALGGHENQCSFGRAQDYPSSRGQITERKSADPHANQPQRRMTRCGGHAPNLTILSFDQLQPDPAGRHGLAEADGRFTRGNLRLRLQDPRAAGQSPTAL